MLYYTSASLKSNRQWNDTLQNLIDNDFGGVEAYQITQYLRGILFIQVDFLLGSNVYTEEEKDEVMKFFKTVIRCCIAWLKKAPSLLQSQQDQRKDSDIYIVDEDLALLNSGSELMGLL